MVLGRFCTKHWVASTCSTSLVPMPKADAPNAPWVEYCESPHTMVVPGRVKPCSGPIMCTTPWRMSFMPKSMMPKSRQFSSSVRTCIALRGSAMPKVLSVVGTL